MVRADVIDHIIPHKGDKALFWDKRNWQGLCTVCHTSKTNRFDGGYGNARQVGGCGVDGLPLDDEHPWNRPG